MTISSSLKRKARATIDNFFNSNELVAVKMKAFDFIRWNIKQFKKELNLEIVEEKVNCYSIVGGPFQEEAIFSKNTVFHIQDTEMVLKTKLTFILEIPTGGDTGISVITNYYWDLCHTGREDVLLLKHESFRGRYFLLDEECHNFNNFMVNFSEKKINEIIEDKKVKSHIKKYCKELMELFTP